MKISLIIPCYNEEANIQKGVLDRIGNFITEHKEFSEVLIVDDGSSDSTKKIIKEHYLPRFKQFRLIENRHGGKAHAVITGIKEAKEEYAMFSDVDLATPLEESEKLITKIKQGSDIVIGSRNASRVGAPLLRKVMAVGFILIRNVILGLRGIRDTQCGFKMFKTEVAKQIVERLVVFNTDTLKQQPSVSAGFDLEFLFLAQKYRYSIKEVPVIWRHVETKHVHFLYDTYETLRDILTIRWNDILGKYNKKRVVSE